MSSRDGQTEVNEMGLDLDPFADIIPPPSISNARAGGKFRPQMKARPRKETSETVPFSVSSTRIEEHASLCSTVSDNPQPAESIDVGDGKQTDPVGSSLTTLEVLVGKGSLRNDSYRNSGVLMSNDDKSSGLMNSSKLFAADTVHLGDAMGDQHSGLGKSMGENMDIFSSLEYVHQSVIQSPSGIEIPVPALDEKETEEQSKFSAQNSVNSSVHRACDVAILDPISCDEHAIQTTDRRLELEEAVAFYNLKRPDDFSESTIGSGCSTRKFQPKLKVQNAKENFTVSIFPPDEAASVEPSRNAYFDPSKSMYIDEGTILTFSSDDVLGCSSTSLGKFISPDPTTSELPTNEEQFNFVEDSRSSDPNVLLQEELPGETGKESSNSRKRKSSSVENPSQKIAESSLADEMGGSGISSRHLRNRTANPQLVDEPDYDVCVNDGFPSKPSSSSIAEEDDNYDYTMDEDNDNEDRVENTFQEKRALEKPKKPATDKDKTARIRKKDCGSSEQSIQEPRKKFSHSTRRKNRLKDLLSMPEDEIDFRNLPVRDIILLAGYKESLANKEAKASKNASSNQSNVNTFNGEASHSEEDIVDSEQDGGYAKDQSNFLFNHHSFMDKTPTARWSKQDTELFYEGIQQFGTDLSMIQQLFPGRTRHQIKLKYKKEERQHPLRLSEALSNRAKDHSHFEKVIEQLQQVAAQAEQESNQDEAVGVTDEEVAELNPETHEEIAKSEMDEGVTAEDQEDGGGIHSPKYDDDDEDLDLWSSYKSAF